MRVLRILIIYTLFTFAVITVILKGYLVVDFLYEYGIIYHIFGYTRILVPDMMDNNSHRLADEQNRSIFAIRMNRKIPHIWQKLKYQLNNLINPGKELSIVKTCPFPLKIAIN